MRKTIEFINKQLVLLGEQPQPQVMPPPGNQQPGVEMLPPPGGDPNQPEITEPQPSKQLPFTGDNEKEYVLNIIKALFFDPNKLSQEETSRVIDFESLIEMGDDINVRPIKDEVMNLVTPDSGIEKLTSKF